MPNNFPSNKEIEKAIAIAENVDDTGLQMSNFKNEDIYWAFRTLAILATSYLDSIMEGFPKPRQVRYEDVKRTMGLDGKIIENEKHITYSKEDEAFNQALSLCKSYHVKVVAKMQEEIAGIQEKFTDRGFEVLAMQQIAKDFEKQNQEKDEQIAELKGKIVVSNSEKPMLILEIGQLKKQIIDKNKWIDKQGEIISNKDKEIVELREISNDLGKELRSLKEELKDTQQALEGK